MPELPEVEQFRQLLLPLASTKEALQICSVNENPPKAWLDTQQIDMLSSNYLCISVLRKGKQLCMVLESLSKPKQTKYLNLHMGMTGRITVPNRIVRLKNQNNDHDSFPPQYTHLTFQAGSYVAAFSDPRRFGSCLLCNDMKAFDELAPDALDTKDTSFIENHIIPTLAEQTTGIKAILLDQKRVVSGVGNWVADEVLYQCRIHPDQSFLTTKQATELFTTLQSILSLAVDCLRKDEDFPQSWLFGYRWTKKRASQDAEGRSISFVKSGGRTSAIVPAIQKLYKSQGRKSTGAKRSSGSKNKSAVKASSSPQKKRAKQERPSTSRRGAQEKQAEHGTQRRRSQRIVARYGVTEGREDMASAASAIVDY